MKLQVGDCWRNLSMMFGGSTSLLGAISFIKPCHHIIARVGTHLFLSNKGADIQFDIFIASKYYKVFTIEVLE